MSHNDIFCNLLGLGFVLRKDDGCLSGEIGVKHIRSTEIGLATIGSSDPELPEFAEKHQKLWFNVSQAPMDIPEVAVAFELQEELGMVWFTLLVRERREYRQYHPDWLVPVEHELVETACDVHNVSYLEHRLEADALLPDVASSSVHRPLRALSNQT